MIKIEKLQYAEEINKIQLLSFYYDKNRIFKLVSIVTNSKFEYSNNKETYISKLDYLILLFQRIPFSSLLINK